MKPGHVLLTTVGTAGDIVPFLCLGRTLKARGHAVTLLTHSYYEQESRRAGLDFLALDTRDEFDRFIADGVLLNSGSGIPAFLRRHVLPRVVSHYETIRRCCTPGSILVTRSAPGLDARVASEKLGLPLVSVLMTPSHVATLEVVEQLLAAMLSDEVNSIRAQMDLAPVADWRAWWRSTELHLGLWPEWFGPPELACPAGTLLAGFLWQEPSSAPTAIPDEIRTVLESGAPPILITGGTGLFGGKEFFAASIAACERLDRPGILVTRLPELVPSSLAPQVRWFKEVPSLAQLMPRMGAVIHHGGMGALSQALAAGIPQVILAAGGDRPDNGLCAQRLGVAEFLPASRWQPEVAAESVQRVTSSSATLQRCQDVAQRLRRGDAATMACQAIEAIIEEGRRHTAAGLAAERGMRSPASAPDPRAENIRRLTSGLSAEQQALVASRLRRKKPRHES